MTEIIWAAKPEIFTIWLFSKKVCQLLSETIKKVRNIITAVRTVASTVRGAGFWPERACGWWHLVAGNVLGWKLQGCHQSFLTVRVDFMPFSVC